MQKLLWQSALSTHWAITEDALAVIREIYSEARSREFKFTEEDIQAAIKANDEAGSVLHMRGTGENSASFAVAKGQRLRDTRYASLYENGVAVLDLIGPIFPRANLMTMSSGISMSQFVHDFVVAYNDPAVLGIVLNIDSPGGDVRGVGQGAKIINELATNGKKPVASYASGLMASAAYYVGSAVGPKRIYADEAAQVGSIGVLFDLPKSDGGRLTIVASRSPNKRPDLNTDEGQARYRQRADDILTLFERDVALFRGITPETVYKKYGQGDVFTGFRAKDHSMVDKLSSLSDVVTMVHREAIKSRSTSVSMSMDSLALISFSDEDIADMGLKDSISNLLKTTGFKAEDEQGNNEALDASNESDDSADASEGQEATVIVQSLTDKTRAQLEDEYEPLASAEVNNLVLQSKLMPAEAPQAVLELVNARIDDAMFGGSEVLFIDKEGQLVSGTREEAAQARLGSKDAHKLTTKAVKAVKTDGKTSNLKATILSESEDDTSVEANEAPMSAERRAALLAASPQGQAVLSSKKAEA